MNRGQDGAINSAPLTFPPKDSYVARTENGCLPVNTERPLFKRLNLNTFPFYAFFALMTACS
jgi:hypothetical protein